MDMHPIFFFNGPAYAKQPSLYNVNAKDCVHLIGKCILFLFRDVFIVNANSQRLYYTLNKQNNFKSFEADENVHDAFMQMNVDMDGRCS